jgi:ATP synthase protein I
MFLYQFLLVTGASVIFLFSISNSQVGSVWFGGLIAATNIGLLVRCARRKNKPNIDAAQQALLVAYSCSATRFIAVSGMFMLGMGILKLHPLAVLIGFIAGLLVLLFPLTRKLIQQD